MTLNLKPTSYWDLKKIIQVEAAKNKAINSQFVKQAAASNDKLSKSIREQVPLIYEFWVKTKTIPVNNK